MTFAFIALIFGTLFHLSLDVFQGMGHFLRNRVKPLTLIKTLVHNHVLHTLKTVSLNPRLDVLT